MEIKAQSLLDLREKIQDDLLCWASDKQLDDHDKTIMCQIVVDNINPLILIPQQERIESLDGVDAYLERQADNP